MAPASRRALLSGALTLSVLPISGAVAHVGGSPSSEADYLFQEWMTAYASACECGLSDDVGDARDKVVSALEARTRELPPSHAKAAALCLFTLAFSILSLREPPSENLDDQETALAWHVLKALQPELSGIIATVADDFLEYPDRPIAESLLYNRRGPPS